MPFTPSRKATSGFKPKQFASGNFPKQEPEEVKRSFLQKLGSATGNFAIGVGKGAVSTVSNIGSLGQKGLDAITKPVSEAVTGKPYIPTPTLNQTFEGTNVITPTNTAQKIGFGAEKVAEFIAPSSLISKAQTAAKITNFSHYGKAVSLLGKALNLTTKAAIEGVASGGITALQGGNKEEIKRNATLGAGFSVLGSALSAGKQLFGKIAKGTGEKIQMSVIRPSVVDVKDGFKIENVNKYNLGGSLNQSFIKVNERMNDLGSQLYNIIDEAPNKLDLNQVYEKTIKAFSGEKASSFGQNKNVANVLSKLVDEIDILGDKGIVDLATAQTVKRAAGTQGAWVFGSADPEARAVEKVYSKFYSILKDEIEDASGNSETVRAINKQLSELIPIHNAIIRRLPIAERNNAISLTDAMGLFATAVDPRAAAVAVINKASKSGRVGAALTRMGEKAINKVSKTSLGRRIFGR